ncbi:MAG: hypothetical protein ACKOSQ_06935 [Planctomycetaceae bacterium]
MRRLCTSFVPAFVAVTLAIGARPGQAAVAPALSFEQVARAWMGAVVLLAHDDDDHDDGDRGDGAGSRAEGRHENRGGHHHREPARDAKGRGGHAHDRGDRCGCGKEGCERCARDGRHGPGGHESRVRAHGHHGGPGPQAVMAKMDEILARLARIEARLDGRAGGPPAAGMRGPRPEGRPELPAEAREQMRKRLEEGRERMEQARQAFRQMEERVKKLEAEIVRLKAER